jgi:hypothetical protein
MATEGIDFSWARPGGAAIAEAGKAFVMRYVPYPGDGGKGLTAAEVADYRANGLDIGLVFESTAARHLDGFNAGLVDAQQSQASLAAIGAPPDLPIYFAVDFDAGSVTELTAIAEYQRGAASVLGMERVGIYGSWRVVNDAARSGYATWFWQTYAWSGGRLHPQAHVYQYSNGETLNGEVDYCRAFGDAQGLWKAQEEDAVTITEYEDLLLAQFSGKEEAALPRADRLVNARYRVGEIVAGRGYSVAENAANALVHALEDDPTDGLTEAEVKALIGGARIVVGG